MRTAAVFLFLFLAGCEFSGKPLTEKVVVDVNGRQLTAGALSQELTYRLKDQDALSAKDPKLVSVLKDKIVEEFTVQTLTENWAKENGVILKAEEIDAEVAKIQKSYPDDLAFQQAFKDEGTTFKAWRDRLQNSLLQKVVTKKIAESAPAPTDKELQDYYNEHKGEFTVKEAAQIRQILVTSESDAKALEAELKKGKKMGDLAKKYSISPEGPQGGIVGWIEKGLSDVFEPAFRMKVGQRSPVYKSSFGFHIFELIGRKSARTKPFPEVKDELKRILMEKREQSLYLAWLEEQTRKARVFKDQAFIDALKVETKAE